MGIEAQRNLSEGGKIPIRNLYYLLCYAWDRLEESTLVDVSGVTSDVPVDLLAALLIKALDHIIRRGINKDYKPDSDVLSSVRGRVRVFETERHFLRHNCRVLCEFDELTTDTPANRIIKGTIRLVLSDTDLDPVLAAGLRRLINQLSAVQDVRINSQSFRSLNIDRNSSFYRFVLDICRLVQNAQMPDERIGRYRFRNFLKDEGKMALLFQHFVFNFLRRERKDLDVFREQIAWKVDDLSANARALLPVMETDISIRCGSTRTIIDTKYYRQPLSNRFGVEKFHSSNLYQLFSYLENARSGDASMRGILLYAQVGRSFQERFTIRGCEITLMTLDLSAPWPDIRDSLVGLQLS
jgi:5-methylcytosine-specific restriction enzyme subunit McrC